MSTSISSLWKFWRREEGASMVEYAMLVALIAAVSMVVVAAIGIALKPGFTAVQTGL
jgi:Flp pilus assembly pilin Flp